MTVLTHSQQQHYIILLQFWLLKWNKIDKLIAFYLIMEEIPGKPGLKHTSQ